jgi:hypothetical protein
MKKLSNPNVAELYLLDNQMIPPASVEELSEWIQSNCSDKTFVEARKPNIIKEAIKIVESLKMRLNVFSPKIPKQMFPPILELSGHNLRCSMKLLDCASLRISSVI